MQLPELLNPVEFTLLSGSLEVDITHICYHSSEVRKGSLFFCLKGRKHDGHEFIPDAINRGARAVVVEEDVTVLSKTIPLIKVKDARYAMAIIAGTFYKHPSRSFHLIGITGTNGKTSVTYMLASVLLHLNVSAGTIGTLGYLVNNQKLEMKQTTPTTPESIELQAVFEEMKQRQVEYVVMEVSSMALEMNRVAGLQFDVGIFTNFSQDHLDDHGTIENYRNAKLRLFPLSEKSVVNIDDEISSDVLSHTNGERITYSILTAGTLHATSIENEISGAKFQLKFLEKQYPVYTKMPGMFSVYNTLAVVGACLQLGFEIEKIIEALQQVTAPPGRFEIVPTNTDYTVIVDYAHTPDALENILQTIHSFPIKRIVTVFGCGGNRDRLKRPLMGKVASEYSEICIVTSDNPRHEEPRTIIEDIVKGIQNHVKTLIYVDRKIAIETALSLAQAGDVILIAGKGNENYQIIGDKVIPFDDREVVLKYLIE